MLDHTAVHCNVKFDDYDDAYNAKNHYITNSETTGRLIGYYVCRPTWACWMITSDAYLYHQHVMRYTPRAVSLCNEAQIEIIRARYP